MSQKRTPAASYHLPVARSSRIRMRAGRGERGTSLDCPGLTVQPPALRFPAMFHFPCPEVGAFLYRPPVS